jgi:hypothetical protein
MTVCQNCGYEGEQIYCSNCGQPLVIKRISLAHLLHEVTHTFWHLEKGFLYTLKALATNPGTMQRRYLSGLRLHYQKPFSLFAISATFGALLLFLIYHDAKDEINQFYKHYYFIVQAAMLPFYSFITYLLFKSPKLYYAEALVMNVYMLGFMSVLIIPINVLYFVLPEAIVQILEVTFLISYNTWTYLNFFKGKAIWWIAVKSIVSIVMSYLLFQFASNLVMHWLI